MSLYVLEMFNGKALHFHDVYKKSKFLTDVAPGTFVRIIVYHIAPK